MKLYKNFDTQMKKLLSVAALAGAVLLCSCGGNKTLKMGSLSKFDSLSYALGANIGYGMQYEMSDIPFNFEEVNKGIKEGALDKSKQKHEDACRLEYIDVHLVSSPSVTLLQIRNEVERMAGLVRTNIQLSTSALLSSRVADAKPIEDNEAVIDYLTDAISDFLVKLNVREMNDGDAQYLSLIHI